MTDENKQATHLWEEDHPYYAQEGNYFSTACHVEYESWEDFLEEGGYEDLDLNLLYRWDWHTPDPEDYEPDEEVPGEELRLYFVAQRKASCHSAYVTVTRDQESELRAWLSVRADHMRMIWAPLL